MWIKSWRNIKMQEISLNILDIVQNSVKAKAALIEIIVDEAVQENRLTVTIKDNGSGMSPEQLAAVTNPFYTTRTTRKVGLGVPFFKMAAEMTGGSFSIDSELGRGTELNAVFVYDSIDRMPIGNMTETMTALVQCNPDIDFVYRHCYNSACFTMDTREFRQILGDIPLSELPVLQFIKEYMNENYDTIRKA